MHTYCIYIIEDYVQFVTYMYILLLNIILQLRKIWIYTTLRQIFSSIFSGSYTETFYIQEKLRNYAHSNSNCIFSFNISTKWKISGEEIIFHFRFHNNLQCVDILRYVVYMYLLLITEMYQFFYNFFNALLVSYMHLRNLCVIIWIKMKPAFYKKTGFLDNS